MAFCKYCGTQYPDGGACTNPACPGANPAPVSEANPFAQAEASAQPTKKTSKGVFIALALVVLLIVAAVVVIVLLLNNKKKDDEKKKDSHKAVVETYAESTYDKKGFKDNTELSMLDDVFKEYKKSDDYEDDKEDFEYMIEDLSDEDIKVTLKSVKKGDKLSDDALDTAVDYFEEQAYDYDVEIDDIKITEGYEYIIEYQIKTDDEKETSKRNICVVNVKGDGWKVVPYSAKSLE